MAPVIDVYDKAFPHVFSAECWGGATFDVAYRFLNEDPWERLKLMRKKMPHTLLQMLLRGSNAVGYKNYPDNVLKAFIEKSAEDGIDVLSVEDLLGLDGALTLSFEREEGYLLNVGGELLQGERLVVDS